MKINRCGCAPDVSNLFFFFFDLLRTPCTLLYITLLRLPYNPVHSGRTEEKGKKKEKNLTF